MGEVQQAAGAGGGCGGGGDFFFAAVGLDQGLDQGGPLGVEALAAGFLQYLHDQVGEAAPQGRGEAEEAVFREVFGGGEEAVEVLDHARAGPEPRAFLAGGVGVEGLGGGVEGVEMAFVDDLNQYAAFVPGGDGGADLVFGDHRGEGGGDVGGGAQEGGDGGVGVGAEASEVLGGGEAAEAGDEAVGVALGRGGEAPDFDGLAEPLGCDGGLQFGQGGGGEGGAVAGQRVHVDLGEGDKDEGHWGLLFSAR